MSLFILFTNASQLFSKRGAICTIIVGEGEVGGVCAGNRVTLVGIKEHITDVSQTQLLHYVM